MAAPGAFFPCLALRSGNLTAAPPEPRDMDLAIEVSLSLTFLVGLVQVTPTSCWTLDLAREFDDSLFSVQILLGILNLGFLSVYLSDQLVQGLTTGTGSA